MKAILLGFGNVGKGTLEVLLEKKIDLEIVGISNSKGSVIGDFDLNEINNSVLSDSKFFQKGMNGLNLIEETNPDLVIEMTPTNIEDGGDGLKHIKKALELGKHVVTSNKGPLAFAFPKLKELAKKNNVELRYEATVAAAIPIFNLKQYCLPMNKVNEIHGILNGTTNYILNVMEKRGGELSIIVKEAQEKGFAETDPTADLEGFDVAVKLVILANALLNKDVTMKDVYIEGITGITQESFELSGEKGNTIRLVASASENLLEVRPKIIPKSSTLNVEGALNAVILKMDVMGDLTLVGPGAGKRETANAVVNDVVSIIDSFGGTK